MQEFQKNMADGYGHLQAAPVAEAAENYPALLESIKNILLMSRLWHFDKARRIVQ
jgi:hypothetical protein